MFVAEYSQICLLYESTLTAERLMDALDYFLDDLNFEDCINIHLQQDGAPPHKSSYVRNIINTLLGNRWIGTKGPIQWPAWTPDLTPLDFIFWGQGTHKNSN